ncbi:MAG: alpha-L-fucosidase [Ferruginibacter sp.]
MKQLMLLFISASFFLPLMAQPDGYIYPKEPAVQQNMREWQDLKFGLLMHWGTYSQWGCVESWGLCPEEDTTQRNGPYSTDYFTYKKAYENLQTTFNPVNFDPEKWSKAASHAGMRYVVFTTKHHDGFCMFNTKQTSYSITDKKTPFSVNKRSNIAKEIFDAFRKKGFKTGAYFSKPDWHNENYWWPYFPPKDRNVNYVPAEHPEKWDKFKDFTYKQIEELVTGYGKIDILWLDGGWVLPVRDNPKINQDIDMPKIIGMARDHQPGLIVVDRWGPAQFENYKTPEQTIPEKPLPYPWETCMSMGNSWSYVPGDTYKSAHQLVLSLVKIVSRGGNFLLNIGPGPTGELDPVAYDRLNDIGEWMKYNAEGIYGSEPVAPYSAGNIFYTKNQNNNTCYLFWLSDSDQVKLPGEFSTPLSTTKAIKKIVLLGNGRSMKWKNQAGILKISIPVAARQDKQLKYAAVFRIEYAD